MTELHPLRLQRRLFTDQHPAAPMVAAWAERVRAERHAVPDDHPGRQGERMLSAAVESSLDLWRDWRDQAVVQWTRWTFGPLGLGAWLPPDAPDEVHAVARAEAELQDRRREVLARIGEGGFGQAVCRIVLAGMMSIGSFERRSFRLAQLLAQLQQHDGAVGAAPIDWRRLMRDEARVAAVAPVEALNALAQLLPDASSRERALALAAAVMMIEPTLDNPRSEIIELLIGTLGVDPTRVMDLACSLTAPLQSGSSLSNAAAAAAPRARRRRARAHQRPQGRLPTGGRKRAAGTQVIHSA